MATTYNNYQWNAVAADVKAMAANYPGSSLFIDSYLYGRNDWLGLGAVTSDMGPNDVFFGTRTLNIIILDTANDPTLSGNYAVQRARIVAQFSQFSAYKTIVFVDTATIAQASAAGAENIQGAAPTDIDQLIGVVKSVCNDLSDYGWVYGGTTSYSSASAEDFRPWIESFFSIKVGNT